MPTGAFCRPEAYELFAAAVPRLATLAGLQQAAVAIAKHGLVDADAEAVDRELRSLAATIRGRVRGGSPSALLAHAHQHLFEELGFKGNTADYYDPANSYLPVVLRTRAGIPISLGLVYRIVLDHLGLEACGINAPGHFLVQVRLPAASPLLVDAFHGGRVLTRAEALRRIAATTGRSIERPEAALPVAAHAAWMGRWLRNLNAVFTRRGERDNAGAMVDLAKLLEWRDR